MNTGTILQKLRERKNMSREEVADRLAVGKRTYDRIERGERDLTLPEASLLSELFDVPLESLISNNSTYINNGNSVSVGFGTNHIEKLTFGSEQIEELKDEIKKLNEKLDKLINEKK